jgi:hypothetical protein
MQPVSGTTIIGALARAAILAGIRAFGCNSV